MVSDKTPDIFIIGGGPAGLAAGIAARRRGMRVTVADGTVPPADKACGEGLMPDALHALAGLGIQIPAEDSFPFRGIRFVDRRTCVTADFPGLAGQGVRRTKLHRILVEHAQAVGVELRWGVAVDPASVNAGWIIGADGGNSLVRKKTGLDASFPVRTRFGSRRHYRIRPWSEYVEIYWADRCQVYVTPVGEECVGVAAITDDSKLRLDQALAQLPDLSWRLRPEAAMTTDRGAISASRRLKAVYRDHVALIGDASGSVDAITGEGMCLAFRQAPVLIEAIANGDLARYGREHSRIARPSAWMARLLLALGDHSTLRLAAMRGMASFPFVFAKMLALHTGSQTSYETHFPVTSHDRSGAVRAGDHARTRSGADASPVHAK